MATFGPPGGSGTGGGGEPPPPPPPPSDLIPAGTTTIAAFAYMDSTITSITIPNSVTTIDYAAFQNCRQLTTVIIDPSSSLTYIGDQAFDGCSALTAILIPSKVTYFGNATFMNCTALTSVRMYSSSVPTYYFSSSPLQSIIIGNTVQTIEYSAFINQQALTSVTFDAPSSLTTIATSAFYGCSALTTMELPPTVQTIGSTIFSGCPLLTVTIHCHTIPGNLFSGLGDLRLILGPTVTTIEDRAFQGFTFLTSVTFMESSSSSLNSIGAYAFTGTSLQTITLPSPLATIGEGAFESCTVRTVRLPATLQTMGRNAFATCTDLSACTIDEPSSLTVIDTGTFGRCTSLRQFTFPKSITAINQIAFYGCSSLADFTIDASSALTTIGDAAFGGCTALTAILIPATMVTFGNSLFQGCSSLRSLTLNCSTIPLYLVSESPITICRIGRLITTIPQALFGPNLTTMQFDEPSAVTRFDDNAFYGCSSLTSIPLPSSLTTLGSFVFSRCTSLRAVTLPPQLTTLGEGIFQECSGLELTIQCANVPANLLTSSSVAALTFGTLLQTVPADFASNQYSLTRVTFQFPSAVTSIGDRAFAACTSLQTLVFPESITSLGINIIDWSTSLSNIGFSVPSSLTTIGPTTFTNCPALTDLVLPSTVTAIHPYAFYSDAINYGVTNMSIQKLVVTNAALNADMRAHTSAYNFLQYLTLYEPTITYGTNLLGFFSIVQFGPTSIIGGGTNQSYTFNGPLDLIHVSDAVTSMNDLTGTFTEFAFPRNLTVGVGILGQPTLTRVILPPAAIAIDRGFSNCTALTSISMPPSITDISGSGFAGCTSLTSIDLSYITRIGPNAFSQSGLHSVTIPGTVTTIGEYAFTGSASLAAVYFDPSSSLISIGYSMFFNCFALTTCQLPLSMPAIKISENMFYQCRALREIAIPPSITLIATNAFLGCEALGMVTFPPSLISIGDYAFYKCVSLSTVLFKSKPILGIASFIDTPYLAFIRSIALPIAPILSTTLTRFTVSWQQADLSDNLFSGYNIYYNDTFVAATPGTSYTYTGDISDAIVSISVSCNNILNSNFAWFIVDGPRVGSTFPVPSWFTNYLANIGPALRVLWINGYGYSHNQAGIDYRKMYSYPQILGTTVGVPLPYTEYAKLCLNVLKGLPQPVVTSELTMILNWQTYNNLLIWICTDMYITAETGSLSQQQAKMVIVSLLPQLLYVGTPAPTITSSVEGYLSVEVSWELPLSLILFIPGVKNNGLLGYNIYKNGTLVSSLQSATSYNNYDLSANILYTLAIEAVSVIGASQQIPTVTFTAHATLPSWWPANVSSFLAGLPNSTVYIPPPYIPDPVAWRMQNAYPQYVRFFSSSTLQGYADLYTNLLTYNSQNGNGNTFGIMDYQQQTVWVAVGADPSGNNILWSTDPTRGWSASPGTPFGTGSGNGVANGNGLWVAVGEDSGGSNILYAERPMDLWTASLGSPFGIGGYGNHVAFGNGWWVAAGYAVSGNNILWSTRPVQPDGIWTAAPGLPFGVGGYANSVAYGSGLWVSVGYQPGGTTILYTTTPSDVWKASPGLPFGPEGEALAIAYGAGLWVAGGYSEAGDTTLVYSMDPSSGWTPCPFGLNGFCNSISYAEGMWVAVGNNANGEQAILYSMDPVAGWLPIPSSAAGIPNGDGVWTVATNHT